MTIQRMIELLEIEHECILRNSHNACDRNCADCDLVQDDNDLHEMYTDVIALLKKQEVVVKCKDCKYWKDGYLNYDVHPWLPCMEYKTNKDWYCADGKRREQK